MIAHRKTGYETHSFLFFVINEIYCKNGTSWGESNITKSMIMKVMIFRVFLCKRHKALKSTQSFSIPLARIKESSSETNKKIHPEVFFFSLCKAQN